MKRILPATGLAWERVLVGQRLLLLTLLSVISIYNHMVVYPPHAPELDRLLRALADATRRDIVRRTARDSQTVSELAAYYDMSFAAVQKHVAVLEEVGLVEKQKEGRKRLVRANRDQIARARACLERLEDLWHHRLTGLDDVLSETKE